jgi:hypothetical protein
MLRQRFWRSTGIKGRDRIVKDYRGFRFVELDLCEEPG